MRAFWILFAGAVTAAFTSHAQEKPFQYLPKLSPSLLLQVQQGTADSITITLLFDNAAGIQPGSYRILHQYHNTATVRMPLKKMRDVVQDSTVLFADLFKTPKEELTTGYLDLAVNKLNAAHARFPDIDGRGIRASIKEQHLDSTDIDYKGRYVTTPGAALTYTTHASIMATTLAGAGNTSPFAVGAAPGAEVTSTSFASLLPEPDAWYQQHNISVQNHSYGTVPEAYYGAEAAAYDQSVVANPTLVHVFSAGNAGTSVGTGPYAGLQGWSNLTGNFKTAKNSLVVGAIDSFYNVPPASSKGPVSDGRVKPELVAFGEDGSSGAAALTSGTVALLQQAYKERNGKLPLAALVRAVLLNSADDLYSKGVDYLSGYGSLNGYNAVKTILDNRIYEDSVQHGDLKKFRITVPRHTAHLKVTLSWTDPPALPNASKALVNDLDAVLQNESGSERWHPWVLSAAADGDSLLKEATQKRDTLNNTEQITIEAPEAGTYYLEVSAANIQTGTQVFAVAYQFDTLDYFEWTFPTRNNPVHAGTTNVVRWQTTITGTGTIEYSTNGTTWQAITDTAALASGYFKWETPDTLVTAQLRMQLSNTQPVLSDTFVISKAVSIQVGFNCADSFLLYWNALPVPQYRIYTLGERYLEPLMTIADTLIILKTTNQHTKQYSVAPVVNGREGLKSYTVDYTMQGTACYFRSFYLQSQNSASATFAVLLGTPYNIAALAFQKRQQSGFVTLQTINAPGSNAFRFTDSNLVQGGNRYRIQLTLSNGALLTSDEISIYHFPDAAVFIYPNPVRSGQIVNMLTSDGEAVQLEIFTATGVLLKKTELNSIINREAVRLPSGVYFIRAIKSNGTSTIQKLVVY